MIFARIVDKRGHGFYFKLHNRRLSIMHYPQRGKWVIQAKRYIAWKEISMDEIAFTDEAMMEIVRAWHSITTDEEREKIKEILAESSPTAEQKQP